MNSLSKALAPHIYPLWIKIGSAVCFIFFIISLSYFPYYCKLNDTFKDANISFEIKDYERARARYSELCILLPTHKKIKLRAAESFFKSSQVEDHKMAFDYLATITLDTYEWKELLAYMPAEYEAFFKDVKVKA